MKLINVLLASNFFITIGNIIFWGLIITLLIIQIFVWLPIKRNFK